MEHQSRYQAKKPDANGIIPYTAEEHQTWSRLMTRQTPVVHARACQEFLHGLNTLQMAPDHIPQNHEINTLLNKKTGWSVVTVEALISDDYFFQLLAEKKFPAASFIRRPEEINYLPEPDIFHELYGHCPMLTNPTYAAFMQKYGEIAAKANPEDRKLLGRLYWFTVEFGLINTSQGLRCYGGGILSSKQETIYAIEDTKPNRRPFNGGIDALRTPYRIDRMQVIYYVIDSFDELFDVINNGLSATFQRARELGEFDVPALGL
jgi:phenylalanine-4-hydroxylase